MRRAHNSTFTALFVKNTPNYDYSLTGIPPIGLDRPLAESPTT
ncbi:hypothetical protein BH20ACI2_BH20ACI2_03060 [soil metagenome]